MTAGENIEDGSGELFSVTTIETPIHLAFVARSFAQPNIRVAHAYVSIKDGKTAELVDIVVLDQRAKRWTLASLFKPTHTGNRGRGLGTALIRFVLEDLRDRGFDRIEGAIHGDPVKLGHWYRRCGFHVDGRSIRRDL